eukprot:TRINITY_DN7408_c0_g1_i2.p1 TRINITY_DN7408_c0_g1~~TRINITY_DN7408_c0_g1_i2.p1  ORF type:complete len:410 (-),score=121.26 TRINITY_DN7408_c0_g1_i2:60-1289(-)
MAQPFQNVTNQVYNLGQTQFPQARGRISLQQGPTNLENLAAINPATMVTVKSPQSGQAFPNLYSVPKPAGAITGGQYTHYLSPTTTHQNQAAPQQRTSLVNPRAVPNIYTPIEPITTSDEARRRSYLPNGSPYTTQAAVIPKSPRSARREDANDKIISSIIRDFKRPTLSRPDLEGIADKIQLTTTPQNLPRHTNNESVGEAEQIIATLRRQLDDQVHFGDAKMNELHNLRQKFEEQEAALLGKTELVSAFTEEVQQLKAEVEIMTAKLTQAEEERSHAIEQLRLFSEQTKSFYEAELTRRGEEKEKEMQELVQMEQTTREALVEERAEREAKIDALTKKLEESEAALHIVRENLRQLAERHNEVAAGLREENASLSQKHAEICEAYEGLQEEVKRTLVQLEELSLIHI